MFQLNPVKVIMHSSTATPLRLGSVGSAALDIAADDEGTIMPGKQMIIETNVQFVIPLGMMIQLLPRSGLAAKHGIFVNAGVIDSDYASTVKVILYNSGDKPWSFVRGDFIAQCMFKQVFIPHISYAAERGGGGFGSTDKK
jgi:dUTP pyrophosphatase